MYKQTFAKYADNWEKRGEERVLTPKPFQQIDNSSLLHWDASLYNLIKDNGYSVEKAGGDYIFAFFPFFPWLWRLSHLPPKGIIILNYLFFSVSIILLLKIFGGDKKPISTTRLLIALSLPGMVVYLIPYTEATFLLMVTLGFYGMANKKYWHFFLTFFFAALTRPSYTFLFFSIIGTELYFFSKHKEITKTLKGIILKSLPLFLGTACVAALQANSVGGSAFKFVEVQEQWHHVFSIPKSLGDWSHESFGINVAVVFLISIPLLVLLIQFFGRRLSQISKQVQLDFEETPQNYLQLLSIFYLVGTGLFIVFFQAGSLNGLFRYTLCSPFFLALLFHSFHFVGKMPLQFRSFVVWSLALASLFVLGLSAYSPQWNFSDTGFFVLGVAVLLWVFQDFAQAWFYKIILYANLFVNVIWTCYLFNTFLADAWIFT